MPLDRWEMWQMWDLHFFAIFACAHIWPKYLVEYLVEFCPVLIGGLESGGRAVITSFLTVEAARRDIVNQTHLINIWYKKSRGRWAPTSSWRACLTRKIGPQTAGPLGPGQLGQNFFGSDSLDPGAWLTDLNPILLYAPRAIIWPGHIQE